MTGPGCDVAIVGAGPAGLAAANVLCEHGLRIAVFDEQPRAGGQILRQPPANFRVDHWLTAKLYARVKETLFFVQDRTDIDWRLGTTVLGILRRSAYRVAGDDDRAHELWVQGAYGCERLSARAVLIASGCYERPLAFPGWTLPGVMGAGAIQVFVKSQRFVPGNRFVLVGSHPLQLVVADQLVATGAQVAAVVFTQAKSAAWAALRHPLTVLRHRLPIMETARILSRLRRAHVPILFGSAITGAEGEKRVQRAIIAPLQADGSIAWTRARAIECDTIGVCHGFLATSELARQAGARVDWRKDEGGWVVDHDEWFEASMPGLFVAGEVTGVAGADAALDKGQLAGIGILRALRILDRAAAHPLAAAARARLKQAGEFAALLSALSRPPANLAAEVMTGESMLCRCESIRRDSFERRLKENPHVVTADAAKLLTRVGMGLCQGRLCGDNVACLIARQRGIAVKSVGAFQAQAPVRPLLLDNLRGGRCS